MVLQKITKYETSFRFAIDGGIGHKSSQKVPRAYFHPKPNVDSVLIVLERHQPLILKKDYKEYQSFVYKWVNREYRVLLLKTNSDRL